MNATSRPTLVVLTVKEKGVRGLVSYLAVLDHDGRELDRTPVRSVEELRLAETRYRDLYAAI
jgi:hypothetical protein